MKLVKVQVKRGITNILKDDTLSYNYICPIESIKTGEYVIMEAKTSYSTSFGIGRIADVVDIDEKDIRKLSPQPLGMVFCRVPVADVDKRCSSIKKMQFYFLKKYKKYYYKKTKKKKMYKEYLKEYYNAEKNKKNTEEIPSDKTE